MTKRRVFAGILLTVFVFCAGCAPAAEQAGPPAPPGPAQTAPAPSPARPPAPTAAPAQTPAPADPYLERLQSMTVEEKVGQLLVAGIEGAAPGEDAAAAVRDDKVGGIILFGRNVESAEQLAALTNGLKALNGDNEIPLFLCLDQEGGRVSRMPPEVDGLPSAYRYGQTGDADLCRRLGRTLAAECAAFGVSVDFAPSLDIWSNPENTVIGDRAFGTDADTVAALGTRTALGLADGGVLSVVKHFPGHGDTAVDSHVGLPVVDRTVDELMERELVPFREAVADGVPAVMVAHILMTQIDPDRPASLSPAVVDGLLRGTLGFHGMVCTDDLTMAAVADTYGMGEAAVLAVEAGCDLLLVCHGRENLEAARKGLLDAAAEGRITGERLDESVRRILEAKDGLPGIGEPVDPPDVDALNALIAETQP